MILVIRAIGFISAAMVPAMVLVGADSGAIQDAVINAVVSVALPLV